MPGSLPPLPTALAGVPSASVSASASAASTTAMPVHHHRPSYSVLPAARSASDLPAYGAVPLSAATPAYAYVVPSGAATGYAVPAEEVGGSYDAPPAAPATAAPPGYEYEYEYEYGYDPNLYYAPSSTSSKRPRYAPLPARAPHSVSSSSSQYLPRSAVLEEQQHQHASVVYPSHAHAHAARHRDPPAASSHAAAPASTSTPAAHTPSHTTPTTMSGVPIPPPASKRQKTQRACDNCRRKRIRCDIIDPLKMCVHCRTYGLSTLLLPWYSHCLHVWSLYVLN